MANPANFRREQFEAANRLRLAGDWLKALQLYRQLIGNSPDQAELHHNAALCLLAMNEHVLALWHANEALRLQPNLLVSLLIKAKAQRKAASESSTQAKETLQTLIARVKEAAGRSPRSVLELAHHASLDLAEIALNIDCDALECLAHCHAASKSIALAERVGLTELMAMLYERTEEDEVFMERVHAFAQRFIEMGSSPGPGRRSALRSSSPGLRGSGQGRRPLSGRLRVGVVSPMLHAGPLFYLCSEGLGRLGGAHDLVYFSRSAKEDWATQILKGQSSQWVDASSLGADALHKSLAESELDVLIEMGGWTDIDSLKAAARRVAKRQYKWVGGQAMSTGLSCFDGFIGDEWQIPRQAESLYTEPIIRLQGGYVRYRGKDHAGLGDNEEPSDRVGGKKSGSTSNKGVSKGSERVWGFIGNPVKISRDCVRVLKSAMDEHGRPQRLRFVDRRYVSKGIQERVRRLFEPMGLPIDFAEVESQADFLAEISRLSAVIDSSPYSAGLTARESLEMGVPLLSYPRSRLFSALHGQAAVEQYRFEGSDSPTPMGWVIDEEPN